MAQEPFFEIKVTTTTTHFALELFRVATELQPRLAPSGRLIEVTASEIQPLISRVFLHNVDVAHCPRAAVEELNQLDESDWSLTSRSSSFDHRSEEHFCFELRSVGGTHPLLVRFLSCSYPLYPLLEQVVLRCHALWDGHLVSIRRQSHRLYGFFQHVDARRSPWLSLLEQEYFGSTYAHKAPSVQRTELERVALKAHALGEQRVGTGDSMPEAEAEAPLPSNGLDADPLRPQPARPLRRPREETLKKLAALRGLFNDKVSGKEPNLSWNIACQRASIDLKTAETYEPELKTAWQTMDGTKR